MAETQHKFVPSVQNIRGLPILDVPWFQKHIIEDALDYMPHDEDVIIGSYPKTGTTWLQYIVLQIISKAEQFPSFHDATMNIIPFMEMSGTKVIDEMGPPRIYKHHFPYNMVKKNPKSKYLYIYRNPEDTFVSYFHFAQSMMKEPIDYEEFFEQFLLGNVGYGDYFEHVKSFLDHKDEENILLISYEKLYVNRKEEILKIARFLGDDYFTPLMKDELLLEKIIEHTQFDYMKKNLSFDLASVTKAEDNQNKDSSFNFFRKGVIGDGKGSLRLDQLERLTNKAQIILNNTHVLKDWYAQK